MLTAGQRRRVAWRHTHDPGAQADLRPEAWATYASYATATSGVVANLGNPGLNTGDAAGDSYFSHDIQGLIGSAFDDVLSSDGRQNQIVTLVGGAGNDTLIDVGVPSTGQVDMAGGAGDDTFYVNTMGRFGVSDNRITEAAGEGFDRVITSVDLDLRFTNPGRKSSCLRPRCQWHEPAHAGRQRFQQHDHRQRGRNSCRVISATTPSSAWMGTTGLRP